MSTRDIQAHLEHLYGVDVSPTLVSNITDKLLPMIKEWQNRPLNLVYAVVFMDAIHYKVKQDGQVVSKASYMVVGIDLDGKKMFWVCGLVRMNLQSSGYMCSPNSRVEVWKTSSLLVWTISRDSVKRFPQRTTKADIQKCVVHQIRNSLKYAPKTTRKSRRT